MRTLCYHGGVNTITIPFDLPGFQIEQVTRHEQLLTIHATSILPSAICPHCGVASHSVQSLRPSSTRCTACRICGATGPSRTALALYRHHLCGRHLKRATADPYSTIWSLYDATHSAPAPPRLGGGWRGRCTTHSSPAAPGGGDTPLRWIQREPLPSPAAPPPRRSADRGPAGGTSAALPYFA